MVQLLGLFCMQASCISDAFGNRIGNLVLTGVAKSRELENSIGTEQACLRIPRVLLGNESLKGLRTSKIGYSFLAFIHFPETVTLHETPGLLYFSSLRRPVNYSL